MSSDSQRLDTWLWASRFYKTRKIANDAVRAGHVSLNDQRSKPARLVHCGDRLKIRRFSEEYTITVEGLSGKRLAAPLASALYLETDQSRQAREQKAALMKAQRAGLRYDRRRPGKRDRQKMIAVKNQTVETD